MGAVGALIMALIKRRLNLKLLRQAMDTTTTLTCFVVFILIGSSVFSLTFRGVNGDLWVEHLLTGLPGGEWGFLIVVSVLVFVLTISALVTPRLLGGPTYQVMSTLIFDEFLTVLNWPRGAAMAFILTAIVLVLVWLSSRLARRWSLVR